jgi:transcriptional regulator with XRE-family HTH domain
MQEGPLILDRVHCAAGQEVSVATRGSPSIQRRRLGIELRRQREQAGLTIEDVATHLECSASKISRIENGQVSATPRDVRDMLALYGVAEEQLHAMMQMAREARVKGWWHSYSDLGNVALVGFEAAAAIINTYEGLLVPSLLQTAEYARAVLRLLRRDLSPNAIERRVEFRMARQSLLAGPKPPTFWVVLDEAVLRRSVGGRGVMSEQMHHLIEMSQSPNITVQVLPFEVGEHPGMSGSFTILAFAEQADPNVVYLENYSSDLYLDDLEIVHQYSEAFDYIRASALSPEASMAFITALVKER